MTNSQYSFTLLSLLVAVLAGIGAMNYIVDPFRYGPAPLTALNQEALSRARNEPLYVLSRARRELQPTIILGDSRAENLKEAYFAERGVEVTNLAFGGGTLYEAIDAFWFATKLRPIERVILGLPFNLWSESNNSNRVAEIEPLLDHPLAYYFSYTVTSVSIGNIWANLLGATRPSSAPPMSRDAFWAYQLGPSIAGFYGRWQEPRDLEARFQKMIAYCREHGIDLILFAPPTHVDLQGKIAEFHLSTGHEKYLDDMKMSGDFLNFDIDDGTTRDRKNFDDPFHADHRVSQQIVQQIVERIVQRADGFSESR